MNLPRSGRGLPLPASTLNISLSLSLSFSFSEPALVPFPSPTRLTHTYTHARAHICTVARTPAQIPVPHRSSIDLDDTARITCIYIYVQIVFFTHKFLRRGMKRRLAFATHVIELNSKAGRKRTRCRLIKTGQTVARARTRRSFTQFARGGEGVSAFVRFYILIKFFFYPDPLASASIPLFIHSV